MKHLNRVVRLSVGTLLLLILGPLASAAEQDPQAQPKATCLDIATAKRVMSEYTFKIRDPKLKLDLCDENNLIRKAVEGLAFMEILPESNSALDAFDNGIIVPSPIQFFRSRISTLIFENVASATGTCDRFTAAYVETNGNGSGAHNSILHVCPYAAQLDSLYLSAVLIHESRHQEGYSHVTCDHGEFATLSSAYACDVSYGFRGAYAVQTEYFVKISRMEKLAADVKQYVRASAINLLMERFNKLPGDLKLGGIAVTENGDGGFYDGSTLTPMFQSGASDDVLVNTGDRLVRFSPKNSDKQSSLDGKNWTPRAAVEGPLAGELLDVYEAGGISCLLTRQNLQCSEGASEKQINFVDFKPIEFATHGPDRLTGNALYIAGENGAMLTMSYQPGGHLPSKLKLVRSKNFGNLLGFKQLNQKQIMALGANGRLGLLTVPRRGNVLDGNSAALTTEGVDPTLHFKALLAPYYWSPNLTNL